MAETDKTNQSGQTGNIDDLLDNVTVPMVVSNGLEPVPVSNNLKRGLENEMILPAVVKYDAQRDKFVGALEMPDDASGKRAMMMMPHTDATAEGLAEYIHNVVEEAIQQGNYLPALFTDRKTYEKMKEISGDGILTRGERRYALKEAAVVPITGVEGFYGDNELVQLKKAAKNGPGNTAVIATPELASADKAMMIYVLAYSPEGNGNLQRISTSGNGSKQLHTQLGLIGKLVDEGFSFKTSPRTAGLLRELGAVYSPDNGELYLFVARR